MAVLDYRGPTSTDVELVGSKAYVDELKATGLTQAQVDTRITNGLATYATKTYVDSKDALNATFAYVDAGDNARLKLAQKGQANGVANLDVTAKVPLAYLPTATQRVGRQPWAPAAYNGNTPIQVTNSSEVTLYTVSILDPGYNYRVLAWGYCETMGGTNVCAAINVRVGSTTGGIISTGSGRVTNANWGDCVFMPSAQGPLVSAGNTTIYVRGFRQQGSLDPAQFSNFKANIYVMIVPG